MHTHTLHTHTHTHHHHHILTHAHTHSLTSPLDLRIRRMPGVCPCARRFCCRSCASTSRSRVGDKCPTPGPGGLKHKCNPDIPPLPPQQGGARNRFAAALRLDNSDQSQSKINTQGVIICRPIATGKILIIFIFIGSQYPIRSRSPRSPTNHV